MLDVALFVQDDVLADQLGAGFLLQGFDLVHRAEGFGFVGVAAGNGAELLRVGETQEIEDE